MTFEGTLIRQALLSSICLIIAVDSLCPTGYTSNNGQCYWHVTTKRRWEDARNHCKGLVNGGDLLSIGSESLKDEVWRLAEYAVASKTTLWVGARSDNYWLNGRSIPSYWWRGGEPNSNNEECIEVWANGDGTGLNDEDCKWKHEFVCEAKECFQIANCISRTSCPWNSNYYGRNQCDQCKEGYYSGGHGNGCLDCTSIAYCQREKCTSSTDQTCIECNYNNVYFKLTNNDRSCDRMCSSDRHHYCWPGSCDNGLTVNCKCADGFRRELTATETLCQPDTLPEVHDCQTIFTGSNGEKKRVVSNTKSTHCQYLQDVYGHFQPIGITFNMTSEYTIDISGLVRPQYIRTEKFGITDTEVIVQKHSTLGQVHTISSHRLKTDTTFGKDAERVVDNNEVLIVNGTKYTLINGDALCVQFKAEGGGYLETYNYYTSRNERAQYDKTVSTETKCYKFDNALPEHCLERNQCETEPLQLDKRVTRKGIVRASFDGWFDPIPNQNFPSQASGIEHFEIRVSETIPVGDKLQVDTRIYYEAKVSSPTTLNLTVSAPKLFCILLEVKDVADNIRQARRFVLYDNTSALEVLEDNSFFINSASVQTSYLWQTHFNDICLTWKDHFFNKFYLHNPLLNPINADPHGFITGIYEQIDGILPVYGTPNVHGIIKYLVSWSVNGESFTEPVEVENFLHQNFCRSFFLEDGQTYMFIVTPVDIVLNTLSENRTVHIDRSAPHINEIGLINKDFKGLVVHDERDLSEMNMYFEVLDPHSGILKVEWWFGIEDTKKELTSGVLGVDRITNECEHEVMAPACYCPVIGLCENYSYMIPLTKLVADHNHLGDHHREYYFKIKATNIAHLSTTEYATILVDYSPPEVGVIFEGSVDGKDVDYTSEDTVMVHWYGFIDHESGINMYRVAFANRCLHRDELYDYQNVTDVVAVAEVDHIENNVRFNITFTGKMYVSIIAFNNAMDPSDAVCSDGITRDKTPPKFYNLNVAHSSVLPAIFCFDNDPWRMNSDLTLSQLPRISKCIARCSETEVLPQYAMALTKGQSFVNSSTDIDMCNTLKALSNDSLIYLPNDYMHLTWDIYENESQLDDSFVGIGIDQSEAENPQMIAYTSTNRKTYFKHRHTGISPGEVFYLFLKAVSRSGLEKGLTIGPMLIDSTPPLYRKKPDVSINGGNIMITWDVNTFYDLEQTEQISRIEYTFGYARNDFKGHFVRRHSLETEGINKKSNRFEWNLMTQQTCNDAQCCCIKYPLMDLQDKDTDLSLEFYVKMYVYNNAGHFTEVDTDLFQIPSRYPPGQAIVYDLDPENIVQFDSDIDVHTTQGTLCASWKGFEHHEDVSINIGVGSDDTQANLVPWQTSDGSNPFCVNASNIQVGQTYYFIVKASSSGGETLSASDGISILDVTDLDSKVTVYAGFDCTDQPPLEIIATETDSGLMNHLEFNTKLEIGGIFLIMTEVDSIPSSIITLNSDDIGTIPENAYGESTSFVTYVERPSFIWSTEEGVSIQKIKLTLFRCPSAKSISATTGFSTHWISSIDPAVFNIWYEAGIVEKGRKHSPVSELEVTYEKMHTFKNIMLQPFTNYQFSIKPCTNQVCFDAVFSDIFYVEMEQPAGVIDFAELKSSSDKSCFDLAMTWKSFQTDSEVLFYQWTISKDELASHIVQPWITVQSSDVNEITQCIEIQPHAYSNLFGCVKAFSLAGSHAMNCKSISMIRSGAYMSEQHVVYDLDYKAGSWDLVLNVLHASDLGNGYKFLHESELDIVPADTGIAGAILGTYGRNITWYLMTSPHIPKEDCNESKDCHFFTDTEDGYVIFPDNIISMNTLYFICAYSDAKVNHLEFLEHILNKFSSCSNGFIKDDEPPLATSDTVYVTNNSGFITDTSRMIIRWDEFEDNVNASLLGYPRNIRSYSYGLGNGPKKDDIMKFQNTGHSTVVVSRDLNIKDGLTVYITVKAFDYVGLESVIVSDELTVDTSPPNTGIVMIEPEMVEVNTVSYISTDYIILHLDEFEDKESGISHFEVGVGTRNFLNDILPLTRHNEDVVQLQLEKRHFIDGRTYFINIKAFNNAGLGSKFKSGKLTIDMSSPTGGHVIDGHLAEEMDEKFSSELYRVQAYWKGFMDPHSHIHYYKCGFGTRPFTDNIRSYINVGLKQAIAWTGPFISGQTYYTTVEACNHAGLCRTLSSDGILLDNSPPIQGLVKIGSEDVHNKFYPHTHWLHIHWTGFQDPESGIDHYEACVGTSIGECDIVPKFSSLLETNFIKTELDLPVNTDLYATVTAYNRVGMSVSYTSDNFRIDNTPPVLVQRPRFLNPLSLKEDIAVQWEKSVLKVYWLFSDPDSPIVNNELAFLTHHEGHTPIEHVSLGAENNFTINLDHTEWLHNGDIYCVKVTACNAAGLCTTSQSTDLRIDSTPPHAGGFTYPLKWTNYINTLNKISTNLTLTWYGFHDPESQIDRFYITASRSYSGYELTGGVFTFKAENISKEYKAEIPLVENIIQDELLILTIWAENYAGLMSSVTRISVFVLSETTNREDYLKYGALEIEKHSCDIHFCNKDCTCAVFSQTCIHFESNSTCRETTSSDIGVSGYPTVDVRFGYKFEEEQTITPSSACLSGSWKLVNSDIMAIERFEWSMGLSDQTIGEGIFDLKAERPWSDVGIREKITHCLPVNRSLLHAESYILYVRAWYTRDIYATFRSNVITIDQSAPTVRRGRFIKDSDGSCTIDYDFIDWTDNITGCWSGVFSEQQGSITHYTISFGTLPHADDVFKKTNVGLETKVTLLNMSLTHSTRYYFTVTAYNTAGLSTALTSDGFSVDTESPVEGIVFNSLQWQHREFQSSDSMISISWSGFADHSSGIHLYYVAVSESNDKETAENLTFVPVVLKSFHTFANMELQQNKTYYGVVKASDAAGHFSRLVFSPGITIDTSKPSAHLCTDYKHAVNGTFVVNKTGKSKLNITLNVTKYDLIHVLLAVENGDFHNKVYIDTGTENTYLHPLRIHDRSLQFERTFFADDSTEKMIEITALSEAESRMDYIVSKCLNLETDDQNSISVAQMGLSILSIDMLIADKESDLCSLELGAGTTEGGFQVQALKKYNHHSNHAVIQTRIGHGSPIYVTAIAENCAGLRSIFRALPINMDHTSPIVDEVHTSFNVLSVDVNGTLDMSATIEATWLTTDEESGVKYCFCALETHPGARDIKPFWEAGTLTACSSQLLELPEGSKVHLVVKCVNKVELYTVYTSDPHIVTYVPPKAEKGKVYFLPAGDDNIRITSDTETYVQTSKSAVKIGWSDFEDAAGILSYEYRLTLGGSPLVNWQTVTARDVVVLDGLNLNIGSSFNYTAEVKATNVNGLTSDTVSANVIVLEEKPTVTGKSVALTKQGNQISLDWSQVFKTYYGIPVSYSLTIGTKKGYTDVIDIGAITSSTKTVTVPRSTLLTPNPSQLYIRISCSYPFGLSQAYEKTYTI